jgi:hypothetical protein
MRDWAPVTVAVCALLFTVGSFWWLYVRRGKLVVTAAQTYAAFLDEGRLILLFPLVFYNTGARDYVVRDLCIRFGDESVGVPLDWERVRGGTDVSAHPTGELATPFAVPGRSALRVFAEFERRPAARTIDARAHPLVLQGVTDREDRWATLLTFTWDVSDHAAETIQQGQAFLAYRNASRLPS